MWRGEQERCPRWPESGPRGSVLFAGRRHGVEGRGDGGECGGRVGEQVRRGRFAPIPLRVCVVAGRGKGASPVPVDWAGSATREPSTEPSLPRRVARRVLAVARDPKGIWPRDAGPIARGEGDHALYVAAVVANWAAAVPAAVPDCGPATCVVRSRFALVTTESDERAIAPAAIIGESTIPKNG
jgi:hypothetical protein